MVTPFDDAGALDVDAAVALARWLADHGSDGLVLSGSTGESSVLTDQEKCDLWRAVAAAVTIPVIAGSGSNDTDHSVKLTARATACGVDGVLVVTPYYNRPSARAASTSISAPSPRPPATCRSSLYDIPVRTGRRIAGSTVLRLAHDVPARRGAQGRRGRPGRHGPSGGPRACRTSRSTAATNDDAAVVVRGCGGRDQRGLALDRAQMGEMIEAFLAGDLAAARCRQRPTARRHRLPVERGVPEPAAGQSDLPCPGPRAASAACPWGQAPPNSTLRLPNHWPPSATDC